MLTTLGFDARYDVRTADWTSGSQPSAHEFSSAVRSARDRGIETSIEAIPGVIVGIVPYDAERWVGRFQAGIEGISGVFATPSPDTVCVVVKGEGYWVPVDFPASFEIVRVRPIKQVMSPPGGRILIFVSYTRLAAYGASGCIWITEDLSWDGIQISKLTEGTVRGSSWDSPSERWIPFSVDLYTGKSEGGSSPAMYSGSRLL